MAQPQGGEPKRCHAHYDAEISGLGGLGNLFFGFSVDPRHQQLIGYREHNRTHEDADQSEGDQSPR